MTDSDLLIDAKGLGKRYDIKARAQGRPGFLARLAGKAGGSADTGKDGFWAVREVDFTVRRGEAVAIIGRNGAGKSTLLRMIAGLANPTEGEIEVNGRVAALLDLGAGLDPNFTGRENIELAASILGMTRSEVRDAFDSIIAFAEIGDFIDQPVKTYSSGMMARLGFAIAAHAKADILIVDEVLAVGDAAFQQKCMRFIRRFTQTGALLFVSHDASTVTSLCQRALWLESGYVRAYGEAAEVTQHFLAALAEEASGEEGFRIKGERRRPPKRFPEAHNDVRDQILRDSDKRNRIEVFEFDPDSAHYGAGGATIEDVVLLSLDGKRLHSALGGEDVILRISGRAEKDLSRIILGFYLKNKLGQYLFGDNTFLTTANDPVSVAKGEAFEAEFQFRLPYLPTGDYAFNAAIATGTQMEHVTQYWMDDALFLKVEAAHFRNSLVGIPMARIELRAGNSAG
ncbi:ABC transporter ATP-binding protein [Marinicauda algicola]|uniref:ABC transporter ATP-binding protein n=1 Tax=Marinicauda algicola TaxID=2029849 RepID=A0A4S2H3V2_9PROT|nr:ABC transporter ATP-binding protein [Marinicauda algicola]TGY90307.1 ABC transporter ATP-binding protein [Marinicauda algicola]